MSFESRRRRQTPLPLVWLNIKVEEKKKNFKHKGNEMLTKTQWPTPTLIRCMAIDKT